ncbi:MAG: hypothetical protein K6A67_00300, partial [Bacteroidales bacterium]|nr:hypothetical protein [Bacteroidales bacterium]
VHQRHPHRCHDAYRRSDGEEDGQHHLPRAGCQRREPEQQRQRQTYGTSRRRTPNHALRHPVLVVWFHIIQLFTLLFRCQNPTAKIPLFLHPPNRQK